MAVVAVTAVAGLMIPGLALAGTGSQPGKLILSPASGATTLRPTWRTTDGCPVGYQGSAEVSEFNTNGTLASRISIVVNGGVLHAFRGTFDGAIGPMLRVTNIKKGGTITFAVGCYSLIGGTGSVKFVQSTLITLSSSGTSYVTQSSGAGAQATSPGTAAAASTGGSGTPVTVGVIAGVCAVAAAVAAIIWYRRRSRSQLM